jgi:hypothetical protein
LVFGLFKKRVDPQLLNVAAGLVRNRFRESLETGCSIYCTDKAKIDETVRRSADAQLMVLSVLRPALDFALQDAYFQAGKIMNFEPLPAALTGDEERGALRTAIADLPTSKANLDMKFRYMFTNNLSSPAEDALWDEMVTISQAVVRRSYEQKSAMNSFWVGVIARLGEGDAEGARRQLMEAK